MRVSDVSKPANREKARVWVDACEADHSRWDRHNLKFYINNNKMMTIHIQWQTMNGQVYIWNEKRRTKAKIEATKEQAKEEEIQ